MNDSTALKIVTFTSWKKRLGNIPTVLDSIFKQTIKPDKVVLNLSVEEFPKKEEELPSDVLKYLKEHDVEIYWVEGKNTKQWKKIIPTLFRYPNDIIICIDDDFVYPNDLIETLYNKYLEFPNNPISGNKIRMFNAKCHCGCASLLKKEYFNDIEKYLKDENIYNFYSSDIFFTYLAEVSKHPYIYAGKEFFMNMKKYNEIEALSKIKRGNGNPIINTWNWLCEKYGKPTENKVENVVDGKKAIETVYGEINKKQRRVVDLMAIRRMRRN